MTREHARAALGRLSSLPTAPCAAPPRCSTPEPAHGVVPLAGIGCSPIFNLGWRQTNTHTCPIGARAKSRDGGRPSPTTWTGATDTHQPASQPASQPANHRSAGTRDGHSFFLFLFLPPPTQRDTFTAPGDIQAEPGASKCVARHFVRSAPRVFTRISIPLSARHEEPAVLPRLGMCDVSVMLVSAVGCCVCLFRGARPEKTWHRNHAVHSRPCLPVRCQKEGR